MRAGTEEAGDGGMDGGGFRAAAADVPGGKAVSNHIRSTNYEREKAPYYIFCHKLAKKRLGQCDRKRGLFLFLRKWI